ncbi:MAG: ROK family protein [Candidatus Omnitrophica bacterium]|nr:ROK family protein [Candidatus Omnitrophota bacterium]MDD5487798.1 ROK family protein [Candidatus Omnitrophota bacterium]
MKKYVIGVDIGGTKIASGIVDVSGKIRKKIELPTMASKGVERSLEQVYLSIDELVGSGEVPAADIKGIGLCAPGPLNQKKGIVYNPPNLKGWNNVPLVELVRKRFRKPVLLENDANAAGVAEMLWGAARGYKHIFYVTVSTGIGTAIIIDGKLYTGKNGTAGEGGHAVIDYKYKGGSYGMSVPGSIEALASGPNTVRRLVSRLKKNGTYASMLLKLTGERSAELTMKDVARAAKKGDKFAMAAVEEQARFLGIWLGSMISLLDPEIIVIGGGVSHIGKMLFDGIKKTIPGHTINRLCAKTPIVKAWLKKDVGLLGAAAVMIRK